MLGTATPTATFHCTARLRRRRSRRRKMATNDFGRSASASGPADRNKGPILDVLKRYLTAEKDGGKVLEIASGAGIHAEHFASDLLGYSFQPTEYAEEAVIGLRERLGSRFPNIAQPLQVDSSQPNWGSAEIAGLTAMIAINLTHISPIEATQGLMQGAGRLLRDDGLLFLYGPFSVNGKPTTESNAAFDASLRERNPQWGYRNLDEVTAMAAGTELARAEVLEMPANNLMLVFRRKGRAPPAAM